MVQQVETVLLGVESIGKDSPHFVDPQSDRGVPLFHCLWLAETETDYDLGEVSQVEQVVTLLGGGQEILANCIVSLEGGLDYLVAGVHYSRVEFVSAELPVDDFGEDCHHLLVIKFGETQEVKMSLEAGSDLVSSSTRRSHGSHEDYVVKSAEGT